MSRIAFSGVIVLVALFSTAGCQNGPERVSSRPTTRSSVVRVDTDDDVHVQAPFVDVRVPKKSRPMVAERDELPAMDD